MENEVKEPAPKYNYISPAEYLEMERLAENRNEYYDGYIAAMSGGSFQHNTIEHNLARLIGAFLYDKDCKMLSSHMRVSTPSRDSYLYPDATIYCGKPELEDDKFDTLLNSSIIFEILSPSTKEMDKRRKLLFYREIPSLKEYVMIDSTKKMLIAVRRRQNDMWQFEDIDGQNQREILIETINCKLLLAEIYRDTGL